MKTGNRNSISLSFFAIPTGLLFTAAVSAAKVSCLRDGTRFVPKLMSLNNKLINDPASHPVRVLMVAPMFFCSAKRFRLAHGIVSSVFQFQPHPKLGYTSFSMSSTILDFTAISTICLAVCGLINQLCPPPHRCARIYPGLCHVQDSHIFSIALHVMMTKTGITS